MMRSSVHNQTADEIAEYHHAGKSCQTNDNGSPLFLELFQTDDSTHVGNQQINTDTASERNQYRITDYCFWDNSPVSDQQYHRGDEYGRNPCLGHSRDHLADDVNNGTDYKCKYKVIHSGFSSLSF